MARRLFPRVVPAIASGTWRAAGQQFRVPVRRPQALPVESFTRVRRAQIMANGINGGVISGSGAATVAVGPQGYGTRWYPNQVAIATQSGAADSSTATIYLNVIGPGGFLAQSYAGGGDQPGIAVPEMQPGDLIYVVWSGGHAGDWCQVQVIGPMDVLVPLWAHRDIILSMSTITTVAIYRPDLAKLNRIKLTESAAQGKQLGLADVLHQILNGTLLILDYGMSDEAIDAET